MTGPTDKSVLLGKGAREEGKGSGVQTVHSVDKSQSKKEANVHKRIALVLALVTIVALVAPSVALAEENESGWWGNIVGHSYPGGAICITAVDGSMINNCHAVDPLRPYDIVKFDGVPPKQYIATSGAMKAYVFAQPGKDNWIDWAWGVPGWWMYPMPVPYAPAAHMWVPGQPMTKAGPPTVNIVVDQAVDVKGSGNVSQTVDVSSPIATNIHVGQSTNVQAAAQPKGGHPAPKPYCFCYVVKSGDSLSKIAVKYGDTVYGLTVRNHISNPSKIYVGQKLTVCDP